MKNSQKQTINVTVSMPADLAQQLRTTAGAGNISRFVVDIIQKALEKQQEELAKAYAAAAQDPDRRKVIEEWSILDVEGLDNEDW